MNFIKKAFVPAAAVAAFLLLLGAIGSTNVAHADDIEDIVPDGGIIAPGDIAIYAIVTGDEDTDTWTVEIDFQTGSASLVGVLEGDDSGGDIDHDIDTQEINDVEGVDLCSDPDESLVEDLVALGLTVHDDDDTLFDNVGCEAEDDLLVVLVVVNCDNLGSFEISFVNEDDNDESQSREFDCRGNADEAEIFASPATVEIIPQAGSKDYSLITVEIEDSNGEAAVPGDEVLFLTDNCGFGENKGKDTVNVESWDDDGDTIAEATLVCNDPSTATPGPAEVTAIIEKSGADIVVMTTVTVVGPPVANGLSAVASPADGLVCGEKATIAITVVDIAGQNVSDHTRLEVVTNFGGVLGGTGAVAGGLGLVTPLSSTVLETFGGTAEVFLITSDTHVGNYEVLITTGGHISSGPGKDFDGRYNESDSGRVDGAPFSFQVTVTCGEPAPEITAPSTGGGITPPSTGDAGLVQTSSSSWMLLAIAGALAFVVAAVGVGKPAFFRN